ncbi:MAG: hypothetical protein IIC64_06305 [SAR324 cluster bacterium]|nr:hypothetical protein [SAR324 cluster bacterium]
MAIKQIELGEKPIEPAEKIWGKSIGGIVLREQEIRAVVKFLDVKNKLAAVLKGLRPKCRANDMGDVSESGGFGIGSGNFRFFGVIPFRAASGKSREHHQPDPQPEGAFGRKFCRCLKLP